MKHPQQLDDELIDLAIECQFDPNQWANVAFDWGHGSLTDYDAPREWQSQINCAIRDHLVNEATRYMPLQIAVASGHGIGKSAEMGMISNWAMSCFEDCRIVTTANTEQQIRTKTAIEVTKWFQRSLTSHWFEYNSMTIKANDPKHGEMWRQDFMAWSDHNTEAFAGLHNKGKIILLLFDEASKISDKVWEVAEGAMTDENTIIIWIVFGNPTRNTGRFRECFRRFKHRWLRWNIDSRDVPGTNKVYLQRLVDDYGLDSDIVKVRVRGEFPAQSAMQFISSDDVDAAKARHYRKDQYEFAPVIIGVDPAWTGDDMLEIYLRQGLYSKHLLTIPRNDNDVHVANKIAMLEDEHHADAVFIDAGYGTGIKSAGDVMGRSWRLIWFGGKPPDEGYRNMRAYMWGRMKVWLKQGGAIDPKDHELADDILNPETVATLDGKIQLESKEDMKERGLPSPNKGDSLALTFAEPVVKKPRYAGSLTPVQAYINGGQRQAHVVEVEYDPYKDMT